MLSIAEIISAAVIIIGSSYIGIRYASKYERAVAQTEAFANALKMLEFDISFLRLPLCEAFERIARGQHGAVKKVFEFLVSELKERKSSNVGGLLMKAVERYEGELEIGEEAKNVLADFSEGLGHMNPENEIANIKSAYVKLKFYEEEARRIAEKNVKMYKGLGLLAGIFIVIILL